MPISVKDFVPEKTKGGMFKSGKIDKFNDILGDMNEWIEQNSPTIVNIETLLLPNIHESDEEGSQDTELYTAGEASSNWYQIIRVWYNS
ncbi:MAG: hypothetical protein ACI8QD_000162 [Cyclobacteriaceae bacterium]|jgi:hypothetical protein